MITPAPRHIPQARSCHVVNDMCIHSLLVLLRPNSDNRSDVITCANYQLRNRNLNLQPNLITDGMWVADLLKVMLSHVINKSYAYHPSSDAISCHQWSVCISSVKWCYLVSSMKRLHLIQQVLVSRVINEATHFI